MTSQMINKRNAVQSIRSNNSEKIKLARSNNNKRIETISESATREPR